MLQGILSLVGEMATMDEWMVEWHRLGFTRASIKIDLSRPLRSGVMIEGSEGLFWQIFVYENLNEMCLHCG